MWRMVLSVAAVAIGSFRTKETSERYNEQYGLRMNHECARTSQTIFTDQQILSARCPKWGFGRRALGGRCLFSLNIIKSGRQCNKVKKHKAFAS